MEYAGNIICKLHYGIIKCCMIVSVTIIAIISFENGFNRKELENAKNDIEAKLRSIVYN